jgi:hypothetical protein
MELLIPVVQKEAKELLSGRLFDIRLMQAKKSAFPEISRAAEIPD